MNTTSEQKSSRLVIIILSVLLALMAGFTIYNMKTSGDKVDSLTDEKLALQNDLDAKIAELDRAMTSNVEMDAALNQAKNELIALKDSISNMKVVNRKTINWFNAEMKKLEKENKMLLIEADSLKLANEMLNMDLDSAHANIEKQAGMIIRKDSTNQVLSEENTNLSEKVAMGAALNIGNVKSIAMKEKSSGTLKETTRANKVDAFRSSFTIRANPIAEAGKKKVYLVIQDATGKVIAPKGNFYDTDGQMVEYSDMTDVEYLNDDMEVIVVSEVPEKILDKGSHYVKVYVENKYLGTAKVDLN
jgi:predicted  nucleic acid-binding Zn-ribbon protein